MWKNIRAVIGYVLFACILLSSLSQANWVLEDKWVERQHVSAATTQRAFYALDRNSTDVLFLGTSHAMYSFIPQVMYDKYGISSYNLSTAAQPVVINRYWFEEALKTQRPKVLVLETFGFHWPDVDENFARTSVTSLKWSPTKIAAMLDVARSVDKDPTEFLFSNMKFHDRWTSLQQQDFTGTVCPAELRGYMPSFWPSNYDGYEPLSEEVGEEQTEFPEHAKQALDRICDICYMNGIKLVLVTIPSREWSQEDHNMVASYVDKKQDVEYYDLNCKRLYEELGYDYAKDDTDGTGHASFSGAVKTTEWIGELLSQGKYGIESHEDEDLSECETYWKQVVAEGKLLQEDDADEYAEEIDLSTHVVFVACPAELRENTRNGLNRWMETLGIEPKDGKFVAVASSMWSSGDVNLVDDDSLTGVLEDGLVTYRLETDDDHYSIKITGGGGVRKEQVPSSIDDWSIGAYVVVYDSVHQVVADKVLLNENDDSGELELHHMY